jgi:type IV pilus assembly protein PilB
VEWGAEVAKRKVGELLVEAGVITPAQVEIALAEQARTGHKLGRVLLDLGLATEESISRALASQSGVEHYDLEAVELDPEAVRLVPEELARRRLFVPIRFENGTIVVAMANPADILATDELERVTDLCVSVASASRRQVQRAIDRAYSNRSKRESPLEAAIRQAMSELESDDPTRAHGGSIGIVEEILALAFQRDATDIHFEPDSKVVRVRFREDGSLIQGPTLPAALLAPIVARIKILAQLDIAETRIPQDGKIRFPFERRTIDLRVSTFPSVDGESVVIRVLDRGREVLSLENIGLQGRQLGSLRGAVARPNGLILAAGPTGSGKTTTLYALLREMDNTHRKVITLEDPVEYDLPLATQCQINEKAGLTFAAGLRSILRHDPDVILVGEMRDQETAGMAFRAALTGHLVFSTIHTNDAVRSVSRLREMEIEPFLIASCLASVSAQRLVRLVCPGCRYEYEPRPEELVAVGLPTDAEGCFVRGKGCERCHFTGARGRAGLFEVMEVTPELARAIARNADVDELEAEACAAGLITFRQEAQRRACAGDISLEEVAKVTAEF